MSSVDNINANDTIVQDTKDLVLSQFAESETIQKFAELIAERVDNYEKLAESIHTSFLLANAAGQTLDFIGEFINLPRDNRTDEQYRNAIIFSAIGSSIEVNREGIESLIALVTGQLGGYFVQGKYKDIYLYLQESCLDRDTAREFLDRYMPLGTELSLLFESGISFGFEGNDAAAGFGTVTAKAAEGQALSKFSLSDAKDSPEYTLPRASTFTHGDDGKVFRSGDPVDLLSNIRAFQWDIPSGYSQGDTVTFSATGQRDARTETTPVSFSKQITLDDVSDNLYELGFEIARAFDENGIASSDEIIFDDSNGTSLFVGYEPITDETKFSSRASEAIEVDTQGNMTLKGVDEVRYRYGIDNDTGSEVVTGIVYEMPSQNEVYDSDAFGGSGGNTEFILSTENKRTLQQSPYRQIRWNDDGSKYYLLKTLDNTIVEFTSIGNFSYQETSSFSFDISGQSTSPAGFDITHGGDYLFLFDFEFTTIHRYDFGTPYDLNTLTYSGITGSPQNGLGSDGIRVADDGNKVFLSHPSQSIVRQYTLATPYDPSILSLGGEFVVDNGNAAPRDIAFNWIGQEFYVASSASPEILRYSCGSYDLTGTTTLLNRLTAPNDVYGVEVTNTDTVVNQEVLQGNLAFTYFDGGQWKMSYFVNIFPYWSSSGYNNVSTEPFLYSNQDAVVIDLEESDTSSGVSFEYPTTPFQDSSYYTFSIFVSTDSDDKTGSLGIDYNYFNFDLDNLDSVSFSDPDYFDGYNIESVGDFYRVSVTKKFLGVPTVVLYVGVGSIGTTKISGAQFEPWHEATSYIPTDGSVTQRAQDFLSINDTEDNISGFSGTYSINIDGKDTSGAYGWGCHELIAKQAEQYAVSDGENFTPDDTNGVDIIATQAAEQFYEGFGEIVEAPEESTSEWGRLCSRESLTSRDFLDLPPVNPEDFEYSLDSRFANVQSLISGNPRALQRSEDDEAWAGPVWDSSLSGQSDAVGRGLALKSPDGTQQYAGIVETTEQDIAGQNIEHSFGDLSVPEAPFYYEIDVELYPVDLVVTDLSHSLVTRYISNVLNEDDGYSRVDVEQSLTINIAYNGTDYDSKVEFSHVQVNEDKENAQASVDSSGITATAETILDNYTAGSVPSTQRIGVLVDGRQGIIRVYKDGVAYDNDTGLIILDDVSTSGSPDNAPNVGDAATIFQNYSDSFVIAAQGSTDNDQAEPSSEGDYGRLRFVYEPSQLSHISQLPPGTTDIFGRNIETLVQ